MESCGTEAAEDQENEDATDLNFWYIEEFFDLSVEYLNGKPTSWTWWGIGNFSAN